MTSASERALGDSVRLTGHKNAQSKHTRPLLLRTLPRSPPPPDEPYTCNEQQHGYYRVKYCQVSLLSAFGVESDREL